MARLVKLCMRGVRSYGPFDDDEQCVSFISPITLIMGQNGSGKTTVIESLKYATTGDAPPGSMRGQAFIHDPKLSAVSEVHSMIRLVFQDAEKQEWSVTRRMRLIQKLKKTEFKTLEVVISRVDKDGVKRDFRGRCLNENVILSAALGVSKPILNHVIFCHQEDSCWPLDEAKTLKGKFDSIFDITKYNKCLENIRKLAKKIDEDLRLLNNQLQNDKIYKKQAEEKRRTLRNSEERYADTLKKIENFDKNLEEVRKKLEKLVADERKICELNTKLDSKKLHLDNVKHQQSELRQIIKEEFPGSTRELYQKIEEFTEQLSEKETKLRQLEVKMQNMKADENTMLSGIGQKQQQIVRMETEERQQQERVNSRNDSLAELAQQLGVPKPEYPEVMNVAEVLPEVRKRVALLREQLDALREQLEHEEHSFQAKIDSCREHVVSLNQEIRMKKEQLNIKKSDERKTVRQIAGVKISDAAVEKVDAELDRVNVDLEVAQSMHATENWDHSIAELVGQRTEFEKKLRAVDERVIELQSQSNLLAEIKVLEKTKAEKEEKIKRLEKDLQRPMMFIFKELPASNIKQCVDVVLSKCESSSRDMTRQVNSKQQELAMLEYKHKEHEGKLLAMEEEVQKNEYAIFEHCESQDLEMALTALQKEIQEHQDEKGVLSSSELMYRHYIEKMQQDEPCCPLCHRSFEEQTSVEELIAELTGQMSEVPRLLRAKEDRLKSLQKKYDMLLQLKPSHQHCHKLRTVDIPAARCALEEASRKAEQVRGACEELKKTLTELQTREKVAKAAYGDVVQLDQLRAEVVQVEQRRADMVSHVAEDPAQSLQAVLEEQSQLRKDLDATTKALEDTRARFNSSKDEINRLRERKNQLATQHLKIQGDLQMRRQLEEKREECEKEIAALSVDISELSERLNPANVELETTIQGKKELQAVNRVKLDTKRAEVNRSQKGLDEVDSLQRAISAHEQRCVSEKLELAKEELLELEAGRQEHESQKQRVADDIDQLKNYLATQKIQERDLQDNVKLRDKLEEEKELTDGIEELGSKIKAFNVKAVLQQKRQLEVTYSNFLTEKAQSEGQQKELRKTIELVEKELNTDVLKNAEDKFNETSFTIKAKDLAKEDLANYSLAMEWAVTHFHSECMKIINTIIRNLWRQIYCGTDIDYIEIKTSAEVKIAERESYLNGGNHLRAAHMLPRVEGSKQARKGLQILASLIIRIALAETFSSKCVFLALDEPTANLDRDNINSFAHALADIVRTRSSRGKFQLIIITHDQQFLEMLNELHLATEYFHVSRNPRARSVIKKQCVRL